MEVVLEEMNQVEMKLFIKKYKNIFHFKNIFIKI